MNKRITDLKMGGGLTTEIRRDSNSTVSTYYGSMKSDLESSRRSSQVIRFTEKSIFQLNKLNKHFYYKHNNIYIKIFLFDCHRFHNAIDQVVVLFMIPFQLVLHGALVNLVPTWWCR